MSFPFLAVRWTAWILSNRLATFRFHKVQNIFSFMYRYLSSLGMQSASMQEEKNCKVLEILQRSLQRFSTVFSPSMLFFSSFLSISPLAWSGARNFLARKANALLRLCPSALVTCPWMPASMACSAETRAAADLPASCLQSGRAKLSLYVQHDCRIFMVGLCLEGLSQPK